MTTGSVGGVGDVSGDFSHSVYRTKNINYDDSCSPVRVRTQNKEAIPRIADSTASQLVISDC